MESTAFPNWVTRCEAILQEKGEETRILVLATNRLFRGLVLRPHGDVLIVETVRQIAGDIHRHASHELRGVELCVGRETIHHLRERRQCPLRSESFPIGVATY